LGAAGFQIIFSASAGEGLGAGLGAQVGRLLGRWLGRLLGRWLGRGLGRATWAQAWAQQLGRSSLGAATWAQQLGRKLGRAIWAQVSGTAFQQKQEVGIEPNSDFEGRVFSIELSLFRLYHQSTAFSSSALFSALDADLQSLMFGPFPYKGTHTPLQKLR